MIIKDLWIIENSGTCLYHYHAFFSDYDIDRVLFSGFIAALSSFTASLTRKEIDYLKMQNDELYFISLENIIVVSIMNAAGGEQQVIKQILKFIGEKFLKYLTTVPKRAYFDPRDIEDSFTKEVEEFCVDKLIYEDIKRELINELCNQVIQGNLPPNILYWKITQLFSDSSPEEIDKLFETFENLKRILPTMSNDIVLLAKINEAFRAVKCQLNIALERERNYFLILCEDSNAFKTIANNFLAYGTLSLLYTNISDLQHAIRDWNEDTPYNLLILKPQLRRNELRLIVNLPLQPGRKIFLYLETSSQRLEKLIFGRKEIVVNIHKHCYTFKHSYCQYGCPVVANIVNQLSNVTIKQKRKPLHIATRSIISTKK
ncbi:MAG: hypothetical protein ACFFDI_28505 [Promethearchaeota archaeon]